MKKVYKILNNHPEDGVYTVTYGDKVIAWFKDFEHAKEFTNIRNGDYYAVRNHELFRIKENIERIFERSTKREEV